MRCFRLLLIGCIILRSTGSHDLFSLYSFGGSFCFISYIFFLTVISSTRRFFSLSVGVFGGSFLCHCCCILLNVTAQPLHIVHTDKSTSPPRLLIDVECSADCKFPRFDRVE